MFVDLMRYSREFHPAICATAHDTHAMDHEKAPSTSNTRHLSTNTTPPNESHEPKTTCEVDDVEYGSLPSPPSETINDPGPPPDGGWTAWAQVLVGALVNVNGFGYMTSYGLFQDYYVDLLHRSPSDIAWIGSIDICLVFLVGVFSGRFADAGHSRLVLTAGAVLQLVGVFMTSVARTYWQLLLAQGFCTGLGLGLLFCPTVSIVGTYFTTKRSLALSTAAAGGAVGGMIYPAIARQLLPRMGIGWTVRIMGFVMIFNFIFVLALVKTRVPPRKAGPLVEWAAFKELSYLLFSVGMFFNGWGIYFAYYYVRPLP